jgi:stress response protein YsnF
MSTLQEAQNWRGRTAVDADGDKIGSIEDVYLDRQSGDPEWIAVKTGLFGTRVSFVPIRDAQPSGDDIRVGHAKDKVKDAPNVDPDGELSAEEERALYEHYGRADYGDWGETSEDRTSGTLGADPRDEERFGRADTGGSGGRDADVSGRSDEGSMTRSEEELHVGTESRETGRARLRKHVTTEEESKTVGLTSERARVEREPITDSNREQALGGEEISEGEHEVTLYEDEPVVEKRVEPKERVRLEKDADTDERTFSEEVRKERIETDGDVGDER